MRHANVILGTVVVVVLLLVYGWAYLSLVERRLTWEKPSATAEYKVPGPLVTTLFWPAHSIDRLIRPKFWTAGGRAADPYDYETFTK